MKKLILTCLVAVLAFAAQAQVKTVEIKTSAICEMCKETLERDLTFEKGVKSVNLNVETKILNIAYLDRKTSPEILRKRVTKVGYNADSLKRDVEAYNKLDECCKDGAHDDDPPKKKKDN